MSPTACNQGVPIHVVRGNHGVSTRAAAIIRSSDFVVVVIAVKSHAGAALLNN